jgi:hypothetical protein
MPDLSPPLSPARTPSPVPVLVEVPRSLRAWYETLSRIRTRRTALVVADIDPDPNLLPGGYTGGCPLADVWQLQVVRTMPRRYAP